MISIYLCHSGGGGEEGIKMIEGEGEKRVSVIIVGETYKVTFDQGNGRNPYLSLHEVDFRKTTYAQ